MFLHSPQMGLTLFWHLGNSAADPGVGGWGKGAMPPPPVPVKTSHKKRWLPSAASYISCFLPRPPTDNLESDTVTFF